MNFTRSIAIVVCSMVCVSEILAQPTEVELEKRGAAAGFVMPIAFALGVLRHECRYWLAGTSDDVDEVARGWWERNRNDLDAATWIFGEALKLNKSTLSPDRAAAAERAVVQGMGTSAINNLRNPFRNQIPTAETCRRAVQQYKASELDIGKLGSLKGFEQFAEFGETLGRVRSDASYRLPEERIRTFENQVSVIPEPIFSLNIMVLQTFEWVIDTLSRRLVKEEARWKAKSCTNVCWG